MSTSVSTAFITDYNATFHEVFQRQGAYLLNTVRYEPNVIGSTHRFQLVGKGTAVTKARHGTITPMNQAHTTADATITDLYAGDWYDKLDESKLSINEKMAIADGGAKALGRAIDDQILTALNGTTQAVQTITVSSEAAVRNSWLQMLANLMKNDIQNDGNIFGVMSPQSWAHLMTVKQFSSSDWVDSGGRPFTEGMPTGGLFKNWMGVKWIMHSGVPGAGTASSKAWLYHRRAVGYAAAAAAGNIAGNASAVADITWHGDRAAHFINHWCSGGAVLIEDTGVIEGTIDDTAAIATS